MPIAIFIPLWWFMALDISIDRKTDIPVYRQIIEKVTSLVSTGILKPGDRLPPERDLALQLGIARGTITKAYEELVRSGILEVAQGRGSFISSRQDVLPHGRKERAVELINTLVNELDALRFSSREIKSIVDLVLLEREERIERFHVAAVDCSPEALKIFCRQLGFLSRIHINTILIDELQRGPEAEKRLAEFDLILTTTTHHSEVLGLAQGLKDRIVQMVFSPSAETIISLAGLKPSQSLGILAESGQFLGIIRGKLEDLCLTNRTDHRSFPCEAETLDRFVADKDVLIVPPGFQTALDRETAAVIAAFTEESGKIIPFDYQIERGSLVYLEERIKLLLER
jgi:DNA-binding transcriptional regulator YhcF (GntR family)